MDGNKGRGCGASRVRALEALRSAGWNGLSERELADIIEIKRSAPVVHDLRRSGCTEIQTLGRGREQRYYYVEEGALRLQWTGSRRGGPMG